MALADKKLTDLDELIVVPADAFIHVVDPNNISQSPEGSSFKAKKINFVNEDLTASHYRGKYNASTNTPTLADGVGQIGDYYEVSVAGTQDYGSGNIVLKINDWLHYNAIDGVWQKWINNSQAPTSTDSVTEGATNLYFTTARVLATVLSGLSLATGGAIVSTDTILQAFGKIQKQINDLSGIYQAILISGTNIKTIDGLSVLGSGNLVTKTLQTNKNAATTDLATQDLNGFLSYVNNVTSFAIAANELVTYIITDSGQQYTIRVNDRSVGIGQTALTSSDVIQTEKGFAQIKRGDFSILTHATYMQPNRITENIGTLLTITGTADDSGTGPSYGGNTFARWVRRRYVSSASAGSNVSHSTAAYRPIDLTSAGQFLFSCHVGNEDASFVTNSRNFFGFYNAASFPNLNPSTGTDIFILGNDSGDANMQIMHNDSSGSATKIDLGASFPANTVSQDHYLFQVWKYSGSTEIHYYVKNIHNGIEASGKVNTNMPASGYYNILLSRNNAGTATAVKLSCSHIIVSENR